MPLTPEDIRLIDEETACLSSVVASLQEQLHRTQSRLSVERDRARELTSSIVNARTVDDKALLASDEAVSHGLRDQMQGESTTLSKLIKKPYFARIVLHEDQATGMPKEIEYKLGFAANPDCRIVDWRKAPISRLYYEYKEGEDYSEEILGRERSGTIKIRNRVEIERSELLSVANNRGHFVRVQGEWRAKHSREPRIKSSAGELPEILSLITPEQFSMITEDAETAILIQGIAGSGKTTVALHRLAWLLHEDNKGADPDRCAILALSPVLRRYIENSLGSVGISGIATMTFESWAAKTLRWSARDDSFTIARPTTPPSHGTSRVKRSLGILRALEAFVAKQHNPVQRSSLQDLKSDLLSVLADWRTIVELDPTRLLDRELSEAALTRTRESLREGVFDEEDDALLLRLYQLKIGNVLLPNGTPGRYHHLVIDEVQDFSPVQLACVIGAVDELQNLTFVGDTSQNVDATNSFPGWEALQKHWNLGADNSKYVSLAVSHRSTLPIMRLADAVQGKTLTAKGREGRTPIWFKTKNESQGIEVALKWLRQATERYPSLLTAVICRDHEEAKFAYRMLSPTFGPLVRLGEASSFSFDEGLVVTEVKQVKGLEFHNVLLWNPSSRAYNSSPLARNFLYVAITRAEENLALVTWSKPSEILPQFGSKLTRCVDLTIEDEPVAPLSSGE